MKTRLRQPLFGAIVYTSPRRKLGRRLTMKTRQTASWNRKRELKLLLLALALGLCVGATAHYAFGLGIVVKTAIVWWNEWWNEQLLTHHRSSQRDLPAPSLPTFESLDFPLDWPEFRGRHRDGIVRENLPSLPWPAEGPPILWKQPVGGGQASFAAAGGRVYTIEQRGEQEHVTSYAIETGQELWTRHYEAHFQSGGPPGPRATPTVAKTWVFALGASGVLNCLDAATGEMIWQRNVLEDAATRNLYWGMAGSPLVRGGKVYLAPGGPEASVIAYDARSGAPLWKSGNHKAGYSSPLIAALGGREHLVIFDGTGLSAYDPETGTVLWHYPWETNLGANVAQPIFVDDSHIFISSERACALLRVISHDGRLGIERVWENRNLKLKYSSAVLSDGHIYGPDGASGAIFVCLDAKTGKRKWKGGRYGFGQVILAGQYLVILCENGDLALVEATPESHREVSRVQALDGDTFSHPVMAEGKLLVRNHREMICFDLTRRN